MSTTRREGALGMSMPVGCGGGDDAGPSDASDRREADEGGSDGRFCNGAERGDPGMTGGAQYGTSRWTGAEVAA